MTSAWFAETSPRTLFCIKSIGYMALFKMQAPQRSNETGDDFFEAMMKDVMQIQKAFEGFGNIFGRIQDAEQDKPQRPGE